MHIQSVTTDGNHQHRNVHQAILRLVQCETTSILITSIKSFISVPDDILDFGSSTVNDIHNYNGSHH
jgi:hypothetical protein